MNTIPEAIAALVQREEELRTLMLSAADPFSQREPAIQAALESLESQLNAVRAEQTTQRAAAAAAVSKEYTEYQKLVARVREVVNHTVPPGATVIVVSKGDNELLKLDGRNAWHFPQNEWGIYAGHYPADSADAIRHVEALRAKGAGYLVFPRTALWWLEHYREFKEHLNKRYRVVSGPDDTCLIYCLARSVARAHTARKSSSTRRSPIQKRSGSRRAPAKARTRAKA